MNSFTLFAVLCAFVALFSNAVGYKMDLKCYQCDESHSSCKDASKSAEWGTVPCDSLNYTPSTQSQLRNRLKSNGKLLGYSCIKIKYHNSTLAEDFVIRTCVDERDNRDVEQLVKEEFKGLISFTTCDTDQCNSANLAKAHLFLGAILASIIYLLH